MHGLVNIDRNHFTATCVSKKINNWQQLTTKSMRVMRSRQTCIDLGNGVLDSKHILLQKGGFALVGKTQAFNGRIVGNVVSLTCVLRSIKTSDSTKEVHSITIDIMDSK